jgi:hypothetical protein
LLYEVAREITDGKPPQVIGIYGDWGSGKTSFLRQLQFLLTYDAPLDQVFEAITDPQKESQRNRENDDDYRKRTVPILHKQLLGKHSTIRSIPVVWFDAWHYQNESAPIVALLHEIRRQFSPGRKLWNFIKKDSQIVLESALLAIEPIAEAIGPLQAGAKFIGKAVGNVQGVATRYETSHLETELSTEQIRRLLSHSIGQVIGAIDYPKLSTWFGFKKAETVTDPRVGPKLLIIIDDLDRCEPEMAVKLLEGIKVFMNLDHCVFVLGLNEHRLLDHVASLHKDYSADNDEQVARCRHRAKDYLDKIINRHYSLGIVFDQQKLIEQYLKGFQCYVPRLPANEADPQWDRVDYEDAVKAVLADPYLLPPNARKIKGFLGMLLRYQSVKFAAPPEPRLLVLFAYLNQFHPRIVRKMAYYPDYALQFFIWAAGDARKPSDTFDELLPAATRTTAQEKEYQRYHDPINANLFHAHDLARDWWQKEGEHLATPDPATLTQPAPPAGGDNGGNADEQRRREELAYAIRPYILLA